MQKGKRGGGIVAVEKSPSKLQQNGSSQQRKAFLKRKTQVSVPPGGAKNRASSKYKYYADNFDEGSKGRGREKEK